MTAQDFDFTDRSVLITGAATGIGQATALAFRRPRGQGGHRRCR